MALKTVVTGSSGLVTATTELQSGVLEAARVLRLGNKPVVRFIVLATLANLAKSVLYTCTFSFFFLSLVV